MINQILHSFGRLKTALLVPLIALPLAFGYFDGFGLGHLGIGHAVAASAADDEAPISAYQQALGIIKKDYYGDPITPKKSKELTFAAIRGMLFSLNDPFTSFLDPDEWRSMQQTTRGDFEGIGAELEQIGQEIRVRRPIPETPAFKIGIKPGDIIFSVDSYASATRVSKTTSTRGMNINDVVKLIKGPAGTKVGLSIVRKGSPAPIHYVITRAHVEPVIVRYWMEDEQNKIGHIMLAEFNEKSDVQLDKALTALEKQGMKALVFDLRYNPGGLLKVAVDVGSRFIESGPVVIIQEKSGQRQKLNVDTDQHNHKRIPLAVLVNENSASASEIVAGAIKDNRTGTLVGEHTFGKGLVQTLFPLDDGSALRLTTAKYFTSNGNDISNKYDDEHRPVFGTGGIKADVEVKQSEDWVDLNFDDKVHDTQLQKALEVLRKDLNTSVKK
ncbi:MAG: S41 family peptidase [Chthonomonadales bacterium]